ncbi:hypothetical protein KUCAC02_037403 [Chaenocephalus aceratus]|nr:hypothetical protein KUCAC02_037403 [Chaenocephalus aceratus]
MLVRPSETPPRKARIDRLEFNFKWRDQAIAISKKPSVKIDGEAAYMEREMGGNRLKIITSSHPKRRKGKLRQMDWEPRCLRHTLFLPAPSPHISTVTLPPHLKDFGSAQSLDWSFTPSQRA